jgi:hypothetical protein
MIAASETGQLIVCVTDGEINEAETAAVKEMFGSDAVIADPLEALYDTSIPTRDAARNLGKLKAQLEARADAGSNVVVLCRRRNEDLGNRAHFMASLCAAADQVHFRSKM